MTQILGKNTPDDELPDALGHWQIRMMGYGQGVSGPFLLYRCPLRDSLCGVPIKPSPPNPNGAAWTWDGNTTAPTLSPSINCIAEKDGKPTGGCGWHGWMQQGRLTGA